MTYSNAIVVGGGIGGLAVATAMARRGIAVTLLEQTPRITEVGAGLQISPNGLAVLRALGLMTQLQGLGAVRGRAVVLKDYPDGRQVARLDLMRLRPDQQYLFMHRADLVRALGSAAKRQGVTVELDAQVASIRPGETPQVQMTDGTTRRAHLVVAADGIHSVARPVLNGADAAEFTGQVAWRAMVPNEVGHLPEAQVHMGPGRHLVSYPLREGTLVNLVAVEERPAWAAEGWHHSDDPENLRAAFAQFGGSVPEMLARVDKVSLWGLHKHPVAARWWGENIALMGDAAHPTLPFLAQGANLALEDAWALAASVSGQNAPGLAAYQRAREKRVRRVIAAADGNAWRYHLPPGPFRRAAHLGLGVASRLLPGRMVGAYDWLYGYDVTKGL
ncbi:MAG: NAD(P)-binding protein [Sulfitobacter sp.]|nr:NAD(P)-binding protein [Sulfitobacter sp.]